MSVGRMLQILGLLILPLGLLFGVFFHGSSRAMWVELTGLLAGAALFVAGVKLDRRHGHG